MRGCTRAWPDTLPSRRGRAKDDMAPSFPFSAIVGQETLKRALRLCVIQPGLGGVLVRGTKGVAKSTAVRALAALLPPIEALAGCPFRRRPGEEVADWPLPAGTPVESRPVALIELPLGATEDRVLGALHLEKALHGQRAFEPGLLAAANRGILYIDEVNLLPDHLVDVLLDAAACGVHRVEREGLSLSHPARFLLVGTMNPEEGDLRPQLLDRFGLAVDVHDLTEPGDRAEAVARRLAYEGDPAGFVAIWQAAEAAEGRRIDQARRAVQEVRIADGLVRSASERCLAAGVEGLRADLTLCQAACAWAAYEGRTVVEPGDLEVVAELALAHRRRRPPEPPGGGRRGSRVEDGGSRIDNGRSRPEEPEATMRPQQGDPRSSILDRPSSAEVIFECSGLFAPHVRPGGRVLGQSVVEGRWRQGMARQRCARRGPLRAAYEPGQAVAWAATLRAAAPHQAARGRTADGARLVVGAGDLRTWPRRGPAGCLLLFVVDASGSMAAWRRMRQTKAAVLALLVQAYQRRDRVALLAFRGGGAEVVLAPVRGLGAARRALEELAVGGPTPLAHGLAAARRLIHFQQRRWPGQPTWTVVLTDGRANVATTAGRDPWADALGQGRLLGCATGDCLVVDTETGWPRLGRAGELAAVLAAPCLPLEEVLGRRLPDLRRRAV